MVYNCRHLSRSNFSSDLLLSVHAGQLATRSVWQPKRSKKNGCLTAKDTNTRDRCLGMMLTRCVARRTCFSRGRLAASGSLSRCMWENDEMVKFPSLSSSNKTFFFLPFFLMIQWQFASHLLEAVVYSQETKVRRPAAKAFNSLFLCVYNAPNQRVICVFLCNDFLPNAARQPPQPLFLLFSCYLYYSGSNWSCQTKEGNKGKRWELNDCSFLGLNKAFGLLIKGLQVQRFKTLTTSYFSAAK